MPLTGNSQYLITHGSDTNLENYALTTIEQSVKRDFIDAYFNRVPLLDYMRKGRGNFNRGFSVEGRKMLIPIVGDDLTSPADGVADADELTADSLNVNAGMTAAEYAFAHYRTTVTIRASEKMIGMGSKAVLANLLAGQAKQIKGSFATALNTDLMSATADTRVKVLGVRYVLSESNTVGGIAQGTDTFWQAKVTTGAGTFSPELIDDLYDECSNQGDEVPDLLLASYATTNNVYGKIRSLMNPALMYTNPGTDLKFGGNPVKYLTMDVVKDDSGTAGEALLINTGTWFVGGQLYPRLAASGNVQATDAMWSTWAMWIGVGNGNPRLNGRLAGIT